MKEISFIKKGGLGVIRPKGTKLLSGILKWVPFNGKRKRVSETPLKKIEIGHNDRILIMAPHPDDEILGCGGIIQDAVKMDIPIKIVFFTMGDFNEWSFIRYRKLPIITPKGVRGMALMRRKEAINAAEVLGLTKDKLVFLGYPDAGTLKIWYSHWANRPPYKGLFTRAKMVPYKNALRPGAYYKGEEILKDINVIIKDFKPTKVFVSHPADYHSDHRALYLFTRVALWDLEKTVRPEIYPYLIHFRRWPKPGGYHPYIKISPPEPYKTQISWYSHRLERRETRLKYASIKEHRTQFKSNSKYLRSFVRVNELFGIPKIIRLRSEDLLISPAETRKGHSAISPEDFAYEGKGSFVGVEEEFARLERGSLVISIKLSRKLSQNFGASLHVFGYRNDKAFGQMPKIHVKIGAIDYAVFDKRKELDKKPVKIVRKSKLIIVKIPFKTLGAPQKVLTGAKTYFIKAPLDRVSWKTLVISKES